MQSKRIHGNSTYTPELGATICERISAGEPLIRICREDDMPSYTTVMGWLNRNIDDFAANYVRAREAQADADADAITDIGLKALSGEVDPQSARVAIEAYKWSASRRAPKKYGDKIAHVGGDPASGDQPVRVAVDVSGMSAATLAELARLRVEGE